MDLELKRSQLKVTIYGKAYEVRKPTVKEYESFAKGAAVGMSEESAIERMTKLLVGCGIPQDALDQLEMEHMTELFQFLAGAKKK